MITWLCKWWLATELCNQYMKGWKDGVNQQLHEPSSAEHGYISESMYWFGYEKEEE